MSAVNQSARGKPPPRGTSSFGGVTAPPPAGGATPKKPRQVAAKRSARSPREPLDITRPTVSSRSKTTAKKPADPEVQSFNLTTNTAPLKSSAKKAAASLAKPPPPTATARSMRKSPTKFHISHTPRTDTRTSDTGGGHNTTSHRPTRVWPERRSAKKAAEPETPKPIVVEKLDSRLAVEVAIQVGEAEILNHDLLIGDVKYMLPSAALVAEIDRRRQEELKRTLLKAQRKFEEHSAGQEQHLTDLKEFLEKATITKPPPPARRIRAKTLEKDRKLILAMDEQMKRALPQTESITNIKNRIKQRGDEVIKMLDNVKQMTG